jgi:dihydrolipoamide dehydrogenase
LKVVQNAKEWGVVIPDSTPTINMTQVHARKDKVVGGLTKGVEFLFKKNKITWIKGTASSPARKIDRRRGEADARGERDHRRHRIRAAQRPGIEIDHKRIITSDEAIHLPQVPKSLVIMGSGAVGVEFASIYRRFGSEVTIIELLPRLVPVEDEAVSAELEKSFRKQGIKCLTGTKVTKATAGADGVELEAQGSDGKTQKLSAEILLVATGAAGDAGLNAEALACDGARLHQGRRVCIARPSRTSQPWAT